MMRSDNTFARYWLPVLVWCSIIFIQSSFAAPNLGPDWLLWEWLPMDKVAHGVIYAILSVLICRALNTLPPWRSRQILLAVTGILLTTLFGLSDEWHQSFVITRTADPIDLGADMAGSIVGALLFFGLPRVVASNRKASHEPNHLP